MKESSGGKGYLQIETDDESYTYISPEINNMTDKIEIDIPINYTSTLTIKCGDSRCIYLFQMQCFIIKNNQYKWCTYPMLPKQPLQFNNLRSLLPTGESQIHIFIAIGIPVQKINGWLNPDNPTIPLVDSLAKMMKYFNCSVDYLHNMTSIKVRI